MWKLPNGSTINAPKNIKIGDVNYPKSIFTRWSVEELNAIGIYPFIEKRVNNRFYKSKGHTDSLVDGTIVRTHETVARVTLDDLKKEALDALRTTLKSYIVRIRENVHYLQTFDAENTVELQEWDSFTTALKAAHATITAQVTAITGLEEMIEYTQSGWSEHIPAAPDEEVI
jgi:hypothetical protein